MLTENDVAEACEATGDISESGVQAAVACETSTAKDFTVKKPWSGVGQVVLSGSDKPVAH